MRAGTAWHEFVKGIRKLLDLDGELELLYLLLGIACLGGVLALWVWHWLQSGHYFAATLLAVTGFALAGLALRFVPAALLIVLGGAAIAAAALFSGHIRLLLP